MPDAAPTTWLLLFFLACACLGAFLRRKHTAKEPFRLALSRRIRRRAPAGVAELRRRRAARRGLLLLTNFPLSWRLCRALGFRDCSRAARSFLFSDDDDRAEVFAVTFGDADITE